MTTRHSRSHDPRWKWRVHHSPAHHFQLGHALSLPLALLRAAIDLQQRRSVHRHLQLGLDWHLRLEVAAAVRRPLRYRRPRQKNLKEVRS